jgi:hypothetical protein
METTASRAAPNQGEISMDSGTGAQTHTAAPPQLSDGLERYAWTAGIVYVLALVAVSVIGLLGGGLSVNDSAATIATSLHDHHQRLVVIACVSVIYAAAFVIYLWKLYHLLRGAPIQPTTLSSLVLVGGVLFVSLHSVSDIGITGMLGAKVASYAARHDPGIAYALYILTYALDSVADVFGSLFVLATGLLTLRTGVLPRWLGWVATLAAPLLFLQGFGLGGVISTFGLILDLIGFLLVLIFILVSSSLLLRRSSRPRVFAA